MEGTNRSVPANETTRTELPLPVETYDLPLTETAAAGSGSEAGDVLSDAMLVQNIQWFCRLRWCVVAFLLAFGLLGQLPPAALAQLGLNTPGLWPFATAGVLIVANVLFVASSRSLAKGDLPHRVRVNLWSQIVLDLLVVTVVVHFVGSIGTYALFAYLFHTVLACIFFSRRQSLAITLLAIALYALCISVERLGIVPPSTVVAGAGAEYMSASALAFNFLLAIGIWMMVWYLSSHLAAMVLKQEAELAATNQRLVAAQIERSRHMLTTTHQLKAPFAAIDANAQLLLNGMCGPLTEDALEVARRITARCRRLATEIQEMLQLANLSSASQNPPDKTPVNVADVMAWCIHQVEPMAAQRGVSITADLGEAWAVAAEDHIRMLLGNLLSNAVVYSRSGGSVSVRCERGADGGAAVTIADRGIGIVPEKLPRIFEEHYRAKEAIQHNKESSGLGLAIVRHVAELYRIRLTVQSRLGEGTTFRLVFAPPPADGDSQSKETPSGSNNDRG